MTLNVYVLFWMQGIEMKELHTFGAPRDAAEMFLKFEKQIGGFGVFTLEEAAADLGTGRQLIVASGRDVIIAKKSQVKT